MRESSERPILTAGLPKKDWGCWKVNLVTRPTPMVLRVAVVATLLVAGSGVGSSSPLSASKGSSTTSSSSVAQPAGTTTSGRTVTAALPTMLGLNAQASRTSVPWSLVGSGWILATGSVSAQSRVSLYLIDPDGGRYLIGPVPSGTLLADWSGDGQRALFVSPSGPSFVRSLGLTTAVDVMDVRTGSTSGFKLPPGDPPTVSFTRPDGTALLVERIPAMAGAVSAGRYSLAGSVQQVYPVAYFGYTESPDGTLLAATTQNGGTDIITNSGRPVRVTAPPAGGTYCSSSWWDDTNLLESCRNGYWLQAWEGGTPTELIRTEDGGEPLWKLPSGYYSYSSPGVACAVTLVKLDPDGAVTRLQPPGMANSATLAGLGTYEGRLAIVASPGSCSHRSGAPTTLEVAWYDPVTGTVTPLFGGTAGGDLRRAILFGNG